MNPFISVPSNIGYTIRFTSRTIAAITGAYTSALALVILPKGMWLLYPQIQVSSAASLTGMDTFLALNSNNDLTGYIGTGNVDVVIASATLTIQVPSIVVPFLATEVTPIYPKARSRGANTNVSFTGYAVLIGN